MLAACRGLRYRNHVGINLVVEGRVFEDQLELCPLPDVRISRIPNSANFSPEMAGQPGLNPLTVEYFCFRDDEIWDAPGRRADRTCETRVAHDEDHEARLLSGFAVRTDKAYPVIELGFEEKIATIKAYLDQFENLAADRSFRHVQVQQPGSRHGHWPLGRPHRPGVTTFDPWMVNIDADIRTPRPRCAAAAPPRSVMNSRRLIASPEAQDGAIVTVQMERR